MENLFKEKAQAILFYVGIEYELDPFSHEVSVSYLNPISVQGIVTDLIFSKIHYAMPGIITDKAKEIVIAKKYKTLIEQSQKIEILGEDETYTGWKENGKLQYRVEDDLIRVYIYVKKDSE